MKEFSQTKTLEPSWKCQECTRGKGLCDGDVVVVETHLTRELFMRCAPIDLNGTAEEQAKKFYNCLPDKLMEQGADMSHVVWERIFFRNVEDDYETLQNARTIAYSEFDICDEHLPIVSCLEQPPCRPQQAFEMQIYAIIPKKNSCVRIESFPSGSSNTNSKIVDIDGYRHLYITNINGTDENGQIDASFRKQSDTMFKNSELLLKKHGIDFTKVLRTWCYLDDIDEDYAEFNLSRNAFFEKENVNRLPASTGIGSGLNPPNALCGFDLYALLNPEGVKIELMHAPTLNEAAEYGASFSRGMKVCLPEKTVLYVSGTASINTKGEVLHLNNTRKQLDRMLLNIQELLEEQGASFANTVQVITYLKTRDDLELFLEAWDTWGLSGIPRTFVEAEVCRPEWLCETELIAILPNEG